MAKKSELSLMGQMKKEAERDFNKFIKYVAELEEENKRLQSALDYANRDREDMHNKIIELGSKRESQRNMNYKLRKENKKLKEDNRFLTKISKEYMKKENIIEIAEFTELYKDDLEEENKKLKEDCELLIETNERLKEKNRELFDENKELKKKLDKLRTDNIYEEGLYD